MLPHRFYHLISLPQSEDPSAYKDSGITSLSSCWQGPIRHPGCCPQTLKLSNQPGSPSAPAPTCQLHQPPGHSYVWRVNVSNTWSRGSPGICFYWKHQPVSTLKLTWQVFHKHPFICPHKHHPLKCKVNTAFLIFRMRMWIIKAVQKDDQCPGQTYTEVLLASLPALTTGPLVRTMLPLANVTHPWPSILQFTPHSLQLPAALLCFCCIVLVCFTG